MRNERLDSEYSELKGLLLETKKAAEDARNYSKSVKNYVRWLRVTGIIRVILIAIPIVLAFIYLPPFFSQFGNLYKDIFGGTTQANILEQFLRKNFESKPTTKSSTVDEFINSIQQKATK